MQFFFSYYSLPVNFLSFPISILSPFLAVKLSELPPYPDIHTCQSLSGISSYYSTEMIHCQGPLNYHVILSSLFCCLANYALFSSLFHSKSSCIFDSCSESRTNLCLLRALGITRCFHIHYHTGCSQQTCKLNIIISIFHRGT